MNRKSGMNWKDGLNNTGGSSRSSFTLFDSGGLLSGVTYSSAEVGNTTLTVTDKIYMYAKRTATAFAYKTFSTSSTASKNCNKVKITFGTNNLEWGWLNISVNGTSLSSNIQPSSNSTIEYEFGRAETVNISIVLYETAYLGAYANITSIEFE